MIFKIIVVIIAIIQLVSSYIRYDPKILIVRSYNKRIVFLWYTDYSSFSHVRKCIKLFTL